MREQSVMRATIATIIALVCLAAPASAQRGLSDQETAQAIIRECLAVYHAERPCACPSDKARNGSRCGKRSAYDRPGGAAPLCYVKDVSAEQISKYQGGDKSFLGRCNPVH
jgi:hypothetical protein